MTRSWVVCSTAALLTATMVPRLVAQVPVPLTVRVYNTARMPAPDLSTARDEADQILRDTGLQVIFRKCGSAAAGASAV